MRTAHMASTLPRTIVWASGFSWRSCPFVSARLASLRQRQVSLADTGSLLPPHEQEHFWTPMCWPLALSAFVPAISAVPSLDHRLATHIQVLACSALQTPPVHPCLIKRKMKLNQQARPDGIDLRRNVLVENIFIPCAQQQMSFETLGQAFVIIKQYFRYPRKPSIYLHIFRRQPGPSRKF